MRVGQRVRPASSVKQTETFFDRPVVRDVVFWVAVGLGLVGGYQTGLDTYRDFNGSVQVEGQEFAALIDFSLAAAYYFGIASLVAVLRRYLRRRAQGDGATQVRSTPAVADVGSVASFADAAPVLDQPPLFHTSSPGTRFCEQCGTALNTGARFCSSCGAEAAAGAPVEAHNDDQDDEELQRLRASVARPLFGSRRVLVAVVLVVAAVAGDWALRNKEMDSIMDAVEISERAIVAGDTATDNAANTVAQLPQSQREAAVRARVYPEARTAAVEVADTGDAVASVFVLPWHRSVRRAQSRYMEHSAAWESQFKEAAQLLDDYDDQTIEINSTFRAAARAFRDAIPPVPLRRLEERVDEVFAD